MIGFWKLMMGNMHLNQKAQEKSYRRFNFVLAKKIKSNKNQLKLLSVRVTPTYHIFMNYNLLTNQ